MLNLVALTLNHSQTRKLFKILQLGASYFLLFRYLFLRRLNLNITNSPYGIKLHSNWDDSTFQYYCTCAYGHYFSNYLKSQKRAFIFLDVGANQGLYSIISAQNAACRHVYAFEPMKPIVSLFAKNLKLNDVEQKVSIIEKAINLIPGKQSLHIFNNQSGRASLKPHNHNGDIVDVDVIGSADLDEIFYGIDVRVILKVDVEGLEYEVLSTIFASKISEQIESIWFEIDENWVDQQAIFKLVKDKGFTNLKKIGLGSHYDILACKQ